MTQRVLYIQNNIITNIIGYPDGEPLPEADADGYYVLATSDSQNVGDVFDMTDTLQERRINKLDAMVYKELFRLTNEVRVLRGQGQITANQYRTYIKTQA
jgi:hypothetical protein